MFNYWRDWHGSDCSCPDCAGVGEDDVLSQVVEAMREAVAGVPSYCERFADARYEREQRENVPCLAAGQADI
jgi:hypothetical protein